MRFINHIANISGMLPSHPSLLHKSFVSWVDRAPSITAYIIGDAIGNQCIKSPFQYYRGMMKKYLKLWYTQPVLIVSQETPKNNWLLHILSSQVLHIYCGKLGVWLRALIINLRTYKHIYSLWEQFFKLQKIINLLFRYNIYLPTNINN